MKRNPRKLKWTKAFRKNAGKEMVVDTTLTFAARRNIPVRYNRELMSKTLEAMKRISEIRQKRERVFYKKRMAGNRTREKELNRKIVETQSHLLPRIRGSVMKKKLEEQQQLEMAVQEKENYIEELHLMKERPSKVFGGEAVRSKRRALRVTNDQQDDDEMDVD